MKVLVTGGGGFLGRRIVELLLERGDEVVSVARGDYPALRELGATTVRGDLGVPEDARRAVEGVDAIIHTAAAVGMWGSYAHFKRGNILATQHLLDAAQAEGVTRLVFTSSPSVTFQSGDVENGPQELPYPDEHLAYYPETKAEAERRVLAAHDPDGLRTTSLRPHLIWGPRDPHLLPRLVARARQGKLKIVGSGTNRVDMTYIDNAAIAHLQALDALDREGSGPGGKAYFVGDGEPVAMWPWLNTLLERLDIKPITSKVPLAVAYQAGAAAELAWKTLRRSGDPPMTRFVATQLATSHWYDMAPARRDFDYTPLTDPDTGLERTLEDLRARGI